MPQSSTSAKGWVDFASNQPSQVKGARVAVPGIWIRYSLQKQEMGLAELIAGAEDQSENSSHNDSNSMDMDDIWAIKKKVVRRVGSDELTATIKAELSHYRHNSDRPDRNDDLFIWWRQNKERFPTISKGAKILLCVPATSVSSERTFSLAGLLYSNTLRNRMRGATAEMLILIKASLKKLELAPSTVPDDEEVQEYELSFVDENNIE